MLGNRAYILSQDTQQYLEAEQLIKKAITIISEIFETNQSRFIADQMVSLGEVYILQKNYSLALETFKQAIEIYEALNRPVKRHVLTA